MARTIKAADMDYGPEEINVLREYVIELRDEALKQGDFTWSVRLSHVIALMHSFVEELKNG